MGYEEIRLVTSERSSMPVAAFRLEWQLAPDFAQVQDKNTSQLRDGLWMQMCFVAGRHEQLRFSRREMRAPIADDPICAFNAITSPPISDDGVKLQSGAKGAFSKAWKSGALGESELIPVIARAVKKSPCKISPKASSIRA